MASIAHSNNTEDATAGAVRPVTIAQVQKATRKAGAAGWELDNIPLHHFSLVAQVMSIKKHTVHSVYHFQDGTGGVDGYDWFPGAESGDVIHVFKYCHVVAELKENRSGRYVQVMGIQEVTDYHQIYFHILDAILATERLSIGAADVPAVSAPARQNRTVELPSEHATRPPIQRRILEAVLGANDAEEGVHVATIARAIQGEGEEISAALECLLDEGVLFTTKDESHFAVAF